MTLPQMAGRALQSTEGFSVVFILVSCVYGV